MDKIKKIFDRHYILLIYFLILVSPILDYRLIPFGPEINYIRIGSLIFTIWFLLGRLRNLNKIQKDTTFYIIVLYSVFKLSSALYTINPADAILNSIFWFNVSLLYLTISNLNINKYSETLIKVIVLAGVINALV